MHTLNGVYNTFDAGLVDNKETEATEEPEYPDEERPVKVLKNASFGVAAPARQF